MKTLITIAALLMLISTVSAQTLDQQVDIPPGTAAPTFFIAGVDACQTFTAGASGYLTRVDAFIEASPVFPTLPASVTASICELDANDTPLVNSILTSVTIPLSQIPTSASWVTFDFTASASPPPYVTPGTKLGILLKKTSAILTWYYQAGTSSSLYVGGELFDILNTTITPFGRDVGFRTWVTPDQVSLDQDYCVSFDLDLENWTLGTDWTNPLTGGAVNNGGFLRNRPTFSFSNPIAMHTSSATSPPIDFSQTTGNVLLSYYRRLQQDFGFLDASFVFQVDRNDGAGWVSIPGTSTSTIIGWVQKTVTLTDVAGNNNVRLRVLSTTEVTLSGTGAVASTVSVDEIKVRVKRQAVSPSSAYLDDFEGAVSDWRVEGSGWEQGFPSQPTLAGTYSGANAWGTGLFQNYAPNSLETLISPVFELSSFTSDAIVEYAVKAELGTGDLFALKVDLFDGNGPQFMPSTVLTTNTGDWQIYRATIPTVGGQGVAQLHFELSSDGSSEAAGVLIDDVRIFQVAYPGSASIEGDDLTMEVHIDGEREYGTMGAYAMTVGENATITTYSATGTLDNGNYYLLGEVFAGAPSFAQAAPDVWSTLGATTYVLDGGAEAPFNFQALLSPGGDTMSYTYPGGVAGFSCMIQAIVVKPGFVVSSFYASSDAFLLQFN